ncbi:tRNA epoxyqueuosine(34) reductase QueG [Clostridiaceae bacterium 35-E11]
MKEKLKQFCQQHNIDMVGIAPIGPYKELERILKDRMDKGYLTGMEEQDISKRVDPQRTMKDVASIIVCAFPYFIVHQEDANISKYAYAKDYHLIVKEELENIGAFLKEEIDGFIYQTFVDTGPFVDRYLAYLSGIGYFGINNHIITDRYGSYVFIGYILNNYPFEPDKPLKKTCIQCGACMKSCPGGAILGDFQINPRRCLSFTTQKKDVLSREEKKLLEKHPMVFGCDICQDVCPHNQNVSYTPIEAFQKSIIYKLEEKEIERISNKAFKRKYGDRAFSWRGRKLILRNLEAQRKTTKDT